MTLSFVSGSTNFCKLLWVSCEVFVLHGYAWIHWVAKSCTTTAYRWLFRDSQPSLRTLWSAVIKSPKFSARGTAPPLRLLHGAVVILVFWQISQFRSWGKWAWTLCLPKPSRLSVVGSKETSWEELACESPCRGISSSTNFCLNSCSHSGIPETTGHPDLSSIVVDTVTGEMSLSIRSSRSRVLVSLTVGDEDELEDVEQWLSCLEDVLEVDW